jgi:hypothetical protein
VEQRHTSRTGVNSVAFLFVSFSRFFTSLQVSLIGENKKDYLHVSVYLSSHHQLDYETDHSHSKQERNR